MVVTGTRSLHSSWDAPIPTESIPLDHARMIGQQTLADVLANEPGLDIVPAIRGQSIRLQGFDSKYVLILIDGQRVAGEVGESFDLASIAVEQIERVEIIRGAASSLYGSDGMGGVVNVILRRSRTNRQDLRLLWATDGAKSLGGQTSFVSPNTDNSFNFNISEQDPWRRTSSPATQFSGTRQADLSWQNNWNLATDWSLKTRLAYQASRIQGTDVAPSGAIWDRENNVSRRSIQLSPEKRFDNGSILKLESQYQDYADAYTTVASLQKSERSREKTYEKLHEHGLTFQHEAGVNHLLTWGLSHIQETLDSDRLQKSQAQRKRNAFFAQDEWSLFRDLTLVPGFRLDDDSQFGDHTSGKLALRYALSDNTLLRPSYGEGYRAPAFKELYLRFENISAGYDVTGNPELKPERSKSYQLALDHRLNAATSLSIHFFRNDITHLIQAQTLESAGEGVLHYIYQNRARARTQGMDLTWHWQGTRLDTTLRYQYLEARDTSLDQVLEGRSRDSISAQIQRLIVNDRWHLHGGIRWLGPQTYFLNESAHQTAAAFTAQAGALYTWDPGWSSAFTIENITNSWEDRLLQVRPRSLTLTLNWNHQNERTRQ
jgi:outer membrane receptor for ferrienterochelin and colicins